MLSRSAKATTHKYSITSRRAERKTLQLAGEELAPNDVCKSSTENPDIFRLAAGFDFWFIGKRQGSLTT